jgi:hypothetical protein
MIYGLLSEVMRSIVKVYAMYFWINNIYNRLDADPGGRAVKGVGPRPFACWDVGFESRRGHGCFCLVSVVGCQVEVSASD